LFFLETRNDTPAGNLSFEEQSLRRVALWLFSCCGLVFAMVILGGVTRLTGSGLSMVDWQPIKGAIPPLSEASWLAVFDQYKNFPEFQMVNQDMTLSGFKFIFLFEYAHRLLGRLIGIAFFLPMAWFWWRGYLSSSLKPKLIVMFVLGGMQGLLGWYMVKSGLVNDPHVSQYRLTAHLVLAILIYAYMLYVARDLQDICRRDPRQNIQSARFEWLLVIVVLVMIASGGLVAGTRAGFIFNTFPDMNGQWIPDGLLALSPLWLNAFENMVTIQFDHRLLAYVLIAMVLYNRFRLTAKSDSGRLVLANSLLLVIALQVCLGIFTLLNQVPVALGVMHQAGALLVLSVAILQLHRSRYVLQYDPLDKIA
jgi:cytochrome c oxidase assembly protein subunit 15